MKLVEANKEHNRRFHELEGASRAAFLENAYAEVFSKTDTAKGEFTPLAVTPELLLSESLNGTRAQRIAIHKALSDSVDKLNFLMTRFSIEGKPELENRVRELALLRTEYQFFLAETGFTQDPQKVADFFTKRGKPEFIRPVLEKLGEEAIKYDHLTEAIIDHPAFTKHLGTDAVQYKFRSRLRSLLDDESLEKEQAAAVLIKEGFDLIANDFNRCFAIESDFNISIGEKKYVASSTETAWLANFVATNKGSTTPVLLESSEELALRKSEHSEDPGHECDCSKEGIEKLNAQVVATIKKFGNRPATFWIRELLALTADHAQLNLDAATAVEAKMWDQIWGGKFNELAARLKGANWHGRTRNGLNYNKWALTHETHRKHINPILAQDSYAMIIAGDILVGDLESAVANFKDPSLQEYKNPAKLRAAINLAWEMMHRPGESDEPKEYKPPYAYLFEVASQFGEFLKDTPRAAPYRKLLNLSEGAKLGEKAQVILDAIRDLDAIERVYSQLGRSAQIKTRFLEIFDRTYDKDTEYMCLYSEVRGVVGLIQNKTFRRYVDDSSISERLKAAVQRSLQKRNKYNSESDERGSKKLVLTMLGNSELQPFIKDSVDIPKMANGMIDDVLRRSEDLINTPLSLRDQGELTLGPSEAIEAYIIADRLRSHVEPQKMQQLVAYLLALNCEMTTHDRFSLASLLIDRTGEEADPKYQRPDFFPDEKLPEQAQRLQFLSNILEREKQLGGLDPKLASTGVTNIIFRGTYAEPNRFYPRIDKMLSFLNSPLAELLPTEGLGYGAVKEYKILRDFLAS